MATRRKWPRGKTSHLSCFFNMIAVVSFVRAYAAPDGSGQYKNILFFLRNICAVAIFLVILRAESGRYASGRKYVKLLK